MSVKTIIISNSQFSEIIKLSEIVLIIAQGSYSEIVLQNKRRITASKNLHWFETKTNLDSLFRVHKSYIINLNFVSKVFNSQYKIMLENGCSIPLARTKKKEFWEQLEKANMVA